MKGRLRGEVVWCILGALMGVGLMGCDVDDDARCNQFDKTLEAKGAQVEVFCREDVDCELVVIHPGLTVAANQQPQDPEIGRVAARRVELCGDFDVDRTIYEAACVSRSCTALPSGTRPPGGGDDAGGGDASPLDDGGPACTCAQDEDCGFGESCVDACACESLCTLSCENVAGCGLLDVLRLGSDVDNCVSRCEPFLESGGADEAELLRCLTIQTCDELESCLL